MLNTERLCMGCMNESDEQICPVCGFDSAALNPKGCLPLRFTVCDRYVIGKVLSVTGEGITYLGWDSANETAVNIKEYFPDGIAHRNPDMTVSIINGNEYPFNEGLLEFIELNKKIAEQNFASLIPVLNVFEENGTAFAIMQSITGITLRDFLARNGGTLKWEQARALFLPIIDTIKGMNDLKIIHKGISVDTIIVGRDGKLRISDYAVNKLRTANSDFDVQLTDGFAAIEQYGGEFSAVDTYTDVYGFAATLFNVLIGAAVPKATLRLENGAMSIPAKFAEELPRHVLAALANALQVKPDERTSDMEKFKNELVYGEIAEVNTKSEKKHENIDASEKKAEKKKKSSSNAKYAVISAVCTVLVFTIIAVVLVFTVFKDDVFGTDSTPSNNNSSTEAPVVDSIGTVDSGAEQTAKLYSVPDLLGGSYSEIIENEEYEKFKFVIVDRAFSDKYPVGTVCAQSLPAKSQVEKDTTIELTMSLGPKEIKIASVKGFEEKDAILELLKQGFLYGNIEVLEKYDEDSKPATVLGQEPKAGTSVSTDVEVKIYINSYEGEDDTAYWSNNNYSANSSNKYNNSSSSQGSTGSSNKNNDSSNQQGSSGSSGQQSSGSSQTNGN